MEAASVSSPRALGSAALVLAALVGVALLGPRSPGRVRRRRDPAGGRRCGPASCGSVRGCRVGSAAAPRMGRSGLAVVVSLGLLCVWIGLTIVWSIAPDRSWDAFNRSLAFLAFLGLGIVLAGLRDGSLRGWGRRCSRSCWARCSRGRSSRRRSRRSIRRGSTGGCASRWSTGTRSRSRRRRARARAVARCLAALRAANPQRPPGDPRDPFGQRIEEPRTQGSRVRANFVNSLSRVRRGLASLLTDRVVATLTVAGGLLVYVRRSRSC